MRQNILMLLVNGIAPHVGVSMQMDLRDVWDWPDIGNTVYRYWNDLVRSKTGGKLTPLLTFSEHQVIKS